LAAVRIDLLGRRINQTQTQISKIPRGRELKALGWQMQAHNRQEIFTHNDQKIDHGCKQQNMTVTKPKLLGQEVRSELGLRVFPMHI
jgi:hypothetical protein